MTRECVKSFKRLSDAVSLEFIVVDNGGEEGLEETLAQRFGDVRYIRLNRNIGFAAGNNVGARESRGRYVMFANQDLTATHQSVGSLVKFMDENPDVALCGPRLLNPDGTIQQSFYRFYTPLTPLYRRTILGRLWIGRQHLDHFLMRDRDATTTLNVDFLMGACLFVRASAIERVGLFDERYFFYFEDTDWCRRFWEAGYRVCYVPSSTMIHIHSRDSAQKMGIASLFDKATRRHITSGAQYFIKHWGKPRVSYG